MISPNKAQSELTLSFLDGEWMRSFLINKNLSFYYWLKKRIGKRWAFLAANSIEKVVLVFGREQVKERK